MEIAMSDEVEYEELPDHLGGHLEKTHIDGGTLRFMKQTYNVTSMLDIGCSIGGMVRLGKQLGITATGIEGDWTLGNYWEGIDVRLHDFHDGVCPDLNEEYDMAWCVEFLEHVDEKYMDHYMDAFVRCKYAVVTAAPPTAVNAHHFNLKTTEYWVEAFESRGFVYDEDVTQKIRRVSAMAKPFMQRTGMFFERA